MWWGLCDKQVCEDVKICLHSVIAMGMNKLYADSIKWQLGCHVIREKVMWLDGGAVDPFPCSNSLHLGSSLTELSSSELRVLAVLAGGGLRSLSRQGQELSKALSSNESHMPQLKKRRLSIFSCVPYPLGLKELHGDSPKP